MHEPSPPAQSRPLSTIALNLESVPSSTNNKGYADSRRHSSVVVNPNQAVTVLVDSEFAYPDGNIELRISNCRFWVHEFQLANFVKLVEQTSQARSRGEITAAPERRVKVRIHQMQNLKSADIRNTLRVIYSTFVSGGIPPSFEVTTLASALRVSTLYQNPYLRDFAITQLQSHFIIAPVYRIELSDELSLPAWETTAFAELCRRPEPISTEEAKVLAEQRRQYIELVKQVATDPFLDINGTVRKDKLQATAKRTLKHSSLPVCDCRVQDSDTASGGIYRGHSRGIWDPYGRLPRAGAKPTSVITCKIQQLAPQLASESYALYKHLSGTLERLEVLNQSISTITHGLLGSSKEYLIENELGQAS